LLIGAQGSGKSTQAKLLAEYLKIPFISTGDMFRILAEGDSELGQQVKNILSEGKLVDDETTSKIVREQISKPDFLRGFILDGYPRNLEQVRLFDPKFDKVIYLNVPEEELLKRLMARGRTDDTPEGIKTRLDLYYKVTEPLVNHYKDLGVLKEVDGRGSIEEVQQRIRENL